MFKKSILALSIAATATSASAVELNAFGDTKFEVNVDLAAYYSTVKDSTGSSLNEITSSEGGNQVEFKVSRKLDNGNTVFGEAEMEFDPVSQSNSAAVVADDMKLGVKGEFGQFMVGQFDSYAEDKVFETLNVANSNTLKIKELKSIDKTQHVQYYNKMGNVKVAVDYASEKSANDYAVTLLGDLGSLNLGIAYANHDGSKRKSTGVKASYDFDKTTVSALYAKTEEEGKATIDVSGLAIETELNDWAFSGAFQAYDAGSETHNQLQLGTAYNVAKDFKVYADIVRMDLANDEGNGVEVGVAYSF
jgi:predicted porin